MKNDTLKKVEKILFIILALLLAVTMVGVALLMWFGKEEKEQSQEEGYDWEAGLSDSTLWLPQNTNLFEEVLDFTYSGEEGELHSISQLKGKPVVVMFWASWCGDCQEQMAYMKEYMEWSKQYGDITFLFVNKTDGQKETKESALAYFHTLELDVPLYFDEGITSYEKLGIHNIPTTLFLDANGVIKAWSPKQITSVEHYDALIQKVIYGQTKATLQFITSELMDESGGIHTIYSKDLDSEAQVLSESQGTMLEYAVMSGNQELFDKILGYIKSEMWEDGLTAWQVTSEDTSKVNALIDDLRIYDALQAGEKLWGGYEEVLTEYETRLRQFSNKNKKFVDFYDTKTKQYATRFTLCYGDLKTMRKLAQEVPELEDSYQNSRDLLVKGQISEEFPLYYSWYDYKSKKYVKDDLNAAEAMVTLLHLSEEGLLPQNTLTWLKTQMAGEGVKARYTVKGKIVKDYNYDSTAVYALIAMIGIEEGDNKLVNQAVRKMEKMRIDNSSLEYNGAFGLEDGTGIYSFDQIMPLFVYWQLEK